MSAREPRFEIVRSHAGWFARFVAANGRKVWQTEIYQRRQRAEQAVWLVVSSLGCGESTGGPEVNGSAWIVNDGVAIEVRQVDERKERPTSTRAPYTLASASSTYVLGPTTTSAATWDTL